MVFIALRVELRAANTDRKQPGARERILTNFDPDGPNYPQFLIVVGGNLLSRGITVPKLTVSVYLRAARTDTMDTYMQHCRFFSHRSHDKDLVTVFMQRRQLMLFKAIAKNDIVMREMMREHIQAGKTMDDPIFLILGNIWNLHLYDPAAKSKVKPHQLLLENLRYFRTPALKGLRCTLPRSCCRLGYSSFASTHRVGFCVILLLWCAQQCQKRQKGFAER